MRAAVFCFTALVTAGTVIEAEAPGCAEVCEFPIDAIAFGTDLFYAEDKVVIFNSMPPDPDDGYERLVAVEHTPLTEGEQGACLIITEVVDDGARVPLDEHGAQFIKVDGQFVSEERLALSIDTERCIVDLN